MQKTLTFGEKIYFWQTISKCRFENSKWGKDLIFINNFWQNIKSFCKQNSILRIHSKPTEFTQNGTEIEKNFHCGLVEIFAEAQNFVVQSYDRTTVRRKEIKWSWLKCARIDRWHAADQNGDHANSNVSHNPRKMGCCYQKTWWCVPIPISQIVDHWRGLYLNYYI